MTHKEAPPETPSQTACREWWAKREPHRVRAWGRDKHGNFLAEESRLLHEAWVASARVLEGYMLVPKMFGIPADAWRAAQFAFGGPGTGDDEPFMDCTAWIGELTGDEGEKIQGLHIWCDECPEEGSITLAEFPAAPKRGEG